MILWSARVMKKVQTKLENIPIGYVAAAGDFDKEPPALLRISREHLL